MTLADGLFLEATLFGVCCSTEDKNEGTKAFLEKRPAAVQRKVVSCRLSASSSHLAVSTWQLATPVCARACPELVEGFASLLLDANLGKRIFGRPLDVV